MKRAGLYGLGFTLIEVMIASVLTALMGVLLMSAINGSIKAKDVVEQISGRDQIIRQAISRMAREISMAYLSKHMFAPDPAYVTQFKGKKDQLFFSAFGHIVHQRYAKQGDQQVLGFYLATDKSGQKSLMRRMRPNLNLDVEKGGITQVLCPNVTGLEFSYFDDQLNKWDDSWTADPTTMGMEDLNPLKKKDPKEEQETVTRSMPKQWRLPSFVKIKLTAKMGEDQEVVWVTETEIPLQEPLDLN